MQTTWSCVQCGRTYPNTTADWRCECGGLFDWTERPRFEPAARAPGVRGVWRYAAALALEPDTVPVTLGEGGTPLVEATWHGRPVALPCGRRSPGADRPEDLRRSLGAGMIWWLSAGSF